MPRKAKTPRKPLTFKSMAAVRQDKPARVLTQVGTITLVNVETGEATTQAVYDGAAWLRSEGFPV